jgi:hypothetical protein
MSQEAIPANERPNESLIPSQPIPAEAHAFSKRMGGLMDGKPKDDATVAQAFEGMDEMLDLIAAALYNLASMLVGEGEDSVRLVETAVATAEVSACHDPMKGRQSSRRALCAAALDVLEERKPGSLAPPPGLNPAATCIENDDLDAAGDSGKELLRMLAGPDRDRVRNWLANLGTVPRTIFVLRAVAGFSAADTAALLTEHGGPKAAEWSADAVSEFCRQGLCSLASQLIQASNTASSC